MRAHHICLLTLLFACKPEESKETPPWDAPTDDTGSPSDDTGDPPDDPPGGPCAELGLPVRDFEDAVDNESMYATAADFSVSLLNGETWTLSEEWSAGSARMGPWLMPGQSMLLNCINL